MKKVCKLADNDKKILRVLHTNPEGLRIKTLQKLTNLKQSTVYKRLNILKSRNLIESVSPIWKICLGEYQNRGILLNDSNIFELHNLSYVVKLIKKPDWWNKRKNYLMRLKEWEFKNVDFGTNPFQQLKNENFVIQAYPQSLIIIVRKRYYSNSPYETSIKAISDVLDLLEWFCERFRFNFFADGVPHLEVRSNDFNRLNDSLANKIRDDGSKFLVKVDERRKVWVDLSEPFGKEANYPEGQEILERVTKDILINKPSLPSKVDSRINDITRVMELMVKNQAMHSQNIIKHQKVLDDMLETLKSIRDGLEDLKKAR